jgi:primosomal protein N'
MAVKEHTITVLIGPTHQTLTLSQARAAKLRLDRALVSATIRCRHCGFRTLPLPNCQECGSAL